MLMLILMNFAAMPEAFGEIMRADHTRSCQSASTRLLRCDLQHYGPDAGQKPGGSLERLTPPLVCVVKVLAPTQPWGLPLAPEFVNPSNAKLDRTPPSTAAASSS
jgi:hypothetical protein